MIKTFPVFNISDKTQYEVGFLNHYNHEKIFYYVTLFVQPTEKIGYITLYFD